MEKQQTYVLLAVSGPCRVSSLFTNIELLKFIPETLPTCLWSEKAAFRNTVSTASPPAPSVHPRQMEWVHAHAVQEALHSCKRRSHHLVLRKVLRLSLADRQLLGCTYRNRNNLLVWLQCCWGPCCSAHAFASLQGITPTAATGRQKPSTSPC